MKFPRKSAQARCLSLCLVLACSSSYAQFNDNKNRFNNLPEPEPWVEQDVAGAPNFIGEASMAFPLGASSLQWSAVPSTFSIGADKVVRFVVLAKGEGGNLNAMYEGLNCAKAEYKVHARWSNADQRWTMQPENAWRSIFDDSYALHIKTLARMGFCDGNTAPNSVEDLRTALL